MDVRVESKDPAKVKCGMLAIGIFEEAVKPVAAAGDVDKALKGLISKLMKSKEITGRSGTSTLIHVQGGIAADHVVVTGLGKSKEFGPDEARKAAATAVRQAKRIKAGKVAFSIPLTTGDPGGICRAYIEGAMISSYEYKGYKSEKGDDVSDIKEIAVIGNTKNMIKKFASVVASTKIICEAVNKARDLVNMPSNKLTPTIFAATAKKVASSNKLKIKVLGAKEILAKKMGAIRAIAKGSIEEPKVLVIRHKASGAKKGTIALIGKGITFDSGGISLKPSRKMDEMKTDMAGAAAVLYAMEAISKLKVKKTVIAVIPLTENMPDGRALKPGDVVETMSGKTVEIISTDAEGRMILADAVTFAKELGASRIIDVATLTGACVVALGDLAAGVLGNDQIFLDEVKEAAGRSGERLWQLPLYKEYKEYLKSSVADFKNCSDLGKAGTSSGATFIKEFVGDTPWVHIDIAGIADLDRDINPYSKGATGAGVFSTVNYLVNS